MTLYRSSTSASIISMSYTSTKDAMKFNRGVLPDLEGWQEDMLTFKETGDGFLSSASRARDTHVCFIECAQEDRDPNSIALGCWASAMNTSICSKVGWNFLKLLHDLASKITILLQKSHNFQNRACRRQDLATECWSARARWTLTTVESEWTRSEQ